MMSCSGVWVSFSLFSLIARTYPGTAAAAAAVVRAGLFSMNVDTHPTLTTTKCFRAKPTNAAASSHVDIHPRETRTSPVGLPSIKSCSSQQT